jgi:NAD(P)-dependent dehydrogenase (short-subunit alcohol dehydrogenase family)
MSEGFEAQARRVVVVTGGAAGIGAAIAEEFGRKGAFVVTMDPVLTLDGSTRMESSEPTTADRIVEAGGEARASNTSVTDEAAVRALFAELVDEFGSLDAVVNVAGISRPTGFAEGSEEDWTAVLSVHLDGYLNVLRAALPIMAEAGRGRILGVTSGSGWRAANAGAYSCAKRAVAALTWQIGQAAPSGVTVNALSPIAATRMVAGALSRQAATGGGSPSGASSASGGVALGAAPPPENLGPAGAYLAGDEFSWSSGQVIFSNGSELSVVAPPHVLEAARTADAKSLSNVLETVIPVAFASAEAAQLSNGGSVPRFGAVFDEPASSGDSTRASNPRRCVIVTDDAGWGAAIAEALTSRDVECVGVGAWQGTRRGSNELASGFAATAEQIARLADDGGPLDAVVVALVGSGAASSVGGSGWQQVLDEHAGIAEHIRTDASWVRAVADYSAQSDRPVRVVTVTNATSAGGRSRGQAAAQLARSARMATADRVDAFTISVESVEESARHATADFVAHLVCGTDVAALSGAELVTATEWVGLRSHPSPYGTVSYGGPAIPEWLDGAMRSIAGTFPKEN